MASIKIMHVREMNLHDVTPLVDIHLAAFKGYMNASLGGRYVRFFFSWFVKNLNSVALVVEQKSDKKISGYVVGAPIGYDSELNRSLLKTGIVAILTHPTIFFHPQFIRTIKNRFKLLIVKKNFKLVLIEEPEGKGISLVGIAVHPSFSKQGIGALLLKSFEEKSVTLGYDYMRLSVYNENLKARGLYEKEGWYCLNSNGNTMYYYKRLQ